MTLTEARPADVPALAAILSDWIDATDWMPRIHTREDDLRFVAGMVAQGGVTVAREGGRVQGFLAAMGATVRALYVAPEARRKGVGHALLDRAKTRGDRLDLWCFQANEEARAFYEAEGFTEAGRTPGANDEGLPDVRLIWRREA